MNPEVFIDRLGVLCDIACSSHGIRGLKPPEKTTICSHPTCVRCSFKNSKFCGTHINHSSLKNLLRELLQFDINERPPRLRGAQEFQRKIRILICLVHRYQMEVPHNHLENLIECMIHYRKWMKIPSVCSRRPSNIVSNPYTIYNRLVRKRRPKGIKLIPIDQVDECPICNDEPDISQLGKLPKCTHIMCQGCWTRWECQGHTTCPMCREEQG